MTSAPPRDDPEVAGASAAAADLPDASPNRCRDEANERAWRGIKLLLCRQVWLQVVTFAGGVVLARTLHPAEFGLYAIATFLVATFSLFGDFGLAPSFIQRREELTDRDLQVGFTLQQVLTTAIVVVLLAAAPGLARLYPKAPAETVWLIRALAFSLYLTSWRSMSALQLERHLRYDRLAWIEVAETLSFQGIAVCMAIAGFGVWSFVWATLSRGVIGAVAVYAAAPWMIRFGFDRRIATGILRFGLPFQLQILWNQVGGWVTPLLVGTMIGPQAVGYLTWASSNGKKPLVLVDNVMRVAFPHFSRIQNDRAEVERTVTRYLTYLLLAAGLWFAVLFTAGEPLIRCIYTTKWTPAVPALTLFAAVMVLDMVAWVLGVCLNGLGLVKVTTRAVSIRSLLTVTIAVPLVYLVGFIGVPIASLLATVMALPLFLAGFGQGAWRRLLAPQAWILGPTSVACVVGALVCREPLPAWAQTIIGVVCVTSVFGVGGYVASPPRMHPRPCGGFPCQSGKHPQDKH